MYLAIIAIGILIYGGIYLAIMGWARKRSMPPMGWERANEIEREWYEQLNAEFQASHPPVKWEDALAEALKRHNVDINGKDTRK